MDNNRPVNLDLLTIKFPITAIASILHRISGVFLFIYMPVMLWALQESLTSASHYQSLQLLMTNIWVKLFILFGLANVYYHLLAGIRHMFMDLGFGESFEAGKRSTYAVLLGTILLVVIMGTYLW